MSAPIVNAVVLAAGRSRRMGRPKPLLPVDDESFLQRVIRVLQEGGCRAVIVVARAGDDDVVRQAEEAGAKVVVNPRSDGEQIESLRVGLSEIEDDAVAVLVQPVDHPLVTVETVGAVLEAFRRTGAPIVCPVYRGVPGHPGLFARRVPSELSEPDLPHGARSVIERHRDEVVEVPVRDAGVIANVDTPDDFRRLVSGAC